MARNYSYKNVEVLSTYDPGLPDLQLTFTHNNWNLKCLSWVTKETGMTQKGTDPEMDPSFQRKALKVSKVS